MSHPHTASRTAALKQWLAQADGVKNLWPSLERQSSLQSDVDAFCRRHHCAPAQVREQGAELVLLGHSPSQSAKLRNLQPSLLAFLVHRGWAFERLAVRVQSTRFSAPQTTPTLRKAELPQQSLSAWQALNETLDAGSLKDAVQRLLRRRTG